MKKNILTTMAVVGAIGACNTTRPNEGESEISARRNDQGAESSNAFGFNLYNELAKSSELEKTNLFISPTSISTAFGMTYMGADGSTRDEMAKVLGISTNQDDAGQRYKKELTALLATKANDGFDLLIANKIWTAADIKFEKGFSKATKDFFRSEAAQVDFKNSAARKKVIKDINQWASDNTNKRITQIVDDKFIKAEMSIVLANAVYFLGDWSNPFPNSGRPLKMPWKKANGQAVEAAMMSDEFTVNYASGPDYQIAELPYKSVEGKDPRISMVIVLPAEGKSLAVADKLLSERSWNAAMGKLAMTELQVTIPKWEVQGESIKLRDYLIKMGMVSAWEEYDPSKPDSTANFSRMSIDRSNVSLSEALHKTFVKVDEKGTEAAAVTVVGGVRATSIRVPSVQFNANRPFVYAIRDIKSGQILFIGRMIDPNSKT